MLESNQISAHDDPSAAFLGVRFILLGFDAVREERIRSKLIECGGVDAVDYGSGCTHVIFDKIVYDDPVCVAARRDGKIIVSALWVEHSYDVGMAVPTTLIIYRPMRDLNGIPGAKSMVACLTGYQRPDREDIMTMVGLMGANFSKPLVAHKVTHLICYKFEGEKYELAKKMKSIKLVNHHWLEDCLKAWELLPETEYSKSGYEVDMEVQAKDSEDETEDKASMREVGRNIAISQTARYESKLPDQSPMKQGMSRNSLYSASKSLVNVGSSHKVQSTPRNDSNIEKASLTRDSSMHLKTSVRSSPKVSSGVLSHSHGGAVIYEMAESSKKSPSNDVSKISDKSHSRSPLKPSVSINSERTEVVTGRRRSTSMMEIYGASGGSKLPLEPQQDGADFYEIAKTPLKESDLQLDKAQNASLPAKTKLTPSHSNSRSPRVSPGLKFPLETDQDGADFNEVVKTPLKKTDLQLDEVHAASLSAKRKMNLLHSNSRLQRMSPGLALPLETHQDEPDFHEVAKTPLKETDLQVDEAQTTSLPAKRKINLSHSNSRSQRVSPGFRSSAESKSAAKTTDMLASEFSFDGSRELAGHTLPMAENNRLTEVASKDGQERSQGVLKSYQRGSKKQTSSDNLELKDHSLNQTDNGSREDEMDQSDKQSPEPPFLKTNVASLERSDQSADLSLSKSGTTGPSLKRMSLSKKRLGSKPGIGNGRIVNTKGSISLKKAMMENDYVAHPDASVVTAETNCVSTANGVMMGNTDRIKASTSKVHEPHREAINEDGLLNDETEAPDDETENQFVESIDVEFEAPDVCEFGADKKVAVDDIGEQSEGNIEGAKVQMVSSEDKNDSGDNDVPGKNILLAEAKSIIDAKKKTSRKGKKCPAKTKKTVSGRDEDSETEERSTKPDENKAVDHNDETVRLVGKAKGRPSKKLKNSIDGEKENKLASPRSLSNDTGAAEKVLSNLPKNTTNESLKSNLGVCGSIKKVHDHETKSEPACFILSGHKLQRKEFQQVIKRLRGKVCRDSHNWSYQATHFIVPDPVRRTEKFFAAAASGSWILKMDYLTSSNEAGKFLSEEPYEWHKKGLSEDGAINLEAPRKWRLIRERTGHCAFHGMCIVIYGECIAPPLDTLKRVIKAGEGTILATSPPYSRFFQSGIDFAVVCPGMPRVDMWVQEFLRHEVPCVSADYLVEYVCKPGYSLERHVQYNTHAWAEKSLMNLVSRVEEVDNEPRTPEDQGTDDVACLVCDSRDRGDEMLICGDESGNLGCGAGMHLDCSDPPLQYIPEEDWFCPSCSKKEEPKSAGQSNSKRSKSTLPKKRSRSKK